MTIKSSVDHKTYTVSRCTEEEFLELVRLISKGTDMEYHGCINGINIHITTKDTYDGKIEGNA
jgi:hypothetical protein